MVGKYLSAGAASGSQWIAAGYLLAPLAVGSLFGGAFACLIRVFGWPANVISIAPISAMFGVLSYVVVMAIDPMISGSFTPRAVWSGIVIALIATWPIALVIGPMLCTYMVQLRRGRKILKDSTVILVSVLCLISEVVFVYVFFECDVAEAGSCKKPAACASRQRSGPGTVA
jgi:hypothetical protein